MRGEDLDFVIYYDKKAHPSQNFDSFGEAWDDGPSKSNITGSRPFLRNHFAIVSRMIFLSFCSFLGRELPEERH